MTDIILYNAEGNPVTYTGINTVSFDTPDGDTKAVFTYGGGSGGIDTSDATATNDDIIYRKTAYANGEKIIGSFGADQFIHVGDRLTVLHFSLILGMEVLIGLISKMAGDNDVDTTFTILQCGEENAANRLELNARVKIEYSGSTINESCCSLALLIYQDGELSKKYIIIDGFEEDLLEWINSYNNFEIDVSSYNLPVVSYAMQEILPYVCSNISYLVYGNRTLEVDIIGSKEIGGDLYNGQKLTRLYFSSISETFGDDQADNKEEDAIETVGIALKECLVYDREVKDTNNNIIFRGTPLGITGTTSSGDTKEFFYAAKITPLTEDGEEDNDNDILGFLWWDGSSIPTVLFSTAVFDYNFNGMKISALKAGWQMPYFNLPNTDIYTYTIKADKVKFGAWLYRRCFISTMPYGIPTTHTISGTGGNTTTLPSTVDYSDLINTSSATMEGDQYTSIKTINTAVLKLDMTDLKEDLSAAFGIESDNIPDYLSFVNFGYNSNRLEENIILLYYTLYDFESGMYAGLALELDISTRTLTLTKLSIYGQELDDYISKVKWYLTTISNPYTEL
jgi:hypothetical protein